MYLLALVGWAHAVWVHFTYLQKQEDEEAKCEMVSKWGPGTEITAVEGYTLLEQISQRRQVVHDLEVFVILLPQAVMRAFPRAVRI